jgi:hypothetical protein
MRPIVILPNAVAALAAGAIGACGPGLTGSRALFTTAAWATAASGPADASATIAPLAETGSIPLPATRYRVETCGGDYVCGDDDAWEVVAQVEGP